VVPDRRPGHHQVVPGTTTLVWTALQPVLAGTAFEDYYSKAPVDDGGRAASVVWCVAASELARRHPQATGVFADEDLDGCCDLWVVVDSRGSLESASIEFREVDDGLVGRPIADVLPVLAERIAAVLR
jgi:hypothetical protein